MRILILAVFKKYASFAEKISGKNLVVDDKNTGAPRLPELILVSFYEIFEMDISIFSVLSSMNYHKSIPK